MSSTWAFLVAWSPASVPFSAYRTGIASLIAGARFVLLGYLVLFIEVCAGDFRFGLSAGFLVLAAEIFFELLSLLRNVVWICHFVHLYSGIYSLRTNENELYVPDGRNFAPPDRARHRHAVVSDN